MPLRILIIGGGIAGLACAIALGQQGHEVEIFEKSAFSNEIGAAVHAGTYTVRVFKRWGMDMSKFRPVVIKHWEDRDVDDPTKIVFSLYNLEEKKKELGIDPSLDELAYHRVDGHSALRECALSRSNVKLHLSSPAADVDPETGTITLANGEKHTGDLVVGADGIHSEMVKAVDADVGDVRTIGINLYRFMVSADTARADPDAAPLLQTIEFPDRHVLFRHAKTGNSLLVYACRDGELLNCATVHPAKDSLVALPKNAYSNPATFEEVQEAMASWPKEYQALARLSQEIKHWGVVTREMPKSSNKGRLVLIGDAHHPMQPTWGAGANMGIEDAAVLGVLFDANTRKEDVRERLELYNKIRTPRTVVVKYVSEMSGLGWAVVKEGTQEKIEKLAPGTKMPVGTSEMLKFLWTVDSVKEAEEAMANLQ